MSGLLGTLGTVFWFLVVLTPIVFVHEFGHYWVARRNGVRVDVFAVGFGRELFGYTDRAGTRWKFCLIPFGGYVKMFGQSDTAPDDDGGESISDADKEVSFYYKKLRQKAAIVAAGPIANFVFAIAVFSILFMTIGQAITPARVAQVQPESAASEAGMLPGDLIVEVDGRSIERFEEVQQLIRLHPGLEVSIIVERDGVEVELFATPRVRIVIDSLDEEQRIGILGIVGGGGEFVRHNPIRAVVQSFRETGRLLSLTGTALKQMVSGDRGADELGGPIRIAQMSGDAASAGWAPLLVFAAFLSINLGLINLFPIPLLDGGHLLFYAYEAVRGRPPGERAQDVGLKIGLAFVLGLMVFATFNDLMRLPLIKQIVALIS